MKNKEVANILQSIADILDIQEVKFKPIAYRRAAQAILEAKDIEVIYSVGELQNIPGVGKHIAEKIVEILDTGKLQYYEKLKKQVRVDIQSLRSIPGLGFRRIKVLYHKLGIKNSADLRKALRERKIRKLAGFGERSEQVLREGLKLGSKKRFSRRVVEPIVKDMLKRLRKLACVEKVEVAGSFRRGKATIGDIDLLVMSDKSRLVMEAFTKLPNIEKVLAKGSTKGVIRISGGLQVDLRIVRKLEFGAAYLYFTGSKEHNIALRKLAASKSWILNEYGLFNKNKKWLAGRTEKEIYTKLKLPYYKPENRERVL
jgi:DNA polymerase (family X)